MNIVTSTTKRYQISVSSGYSHLVLNNLVSYPDRIIFFLKVENLGLWDVKRHVYVYYLFGQIWEQEPDALTFRPKFLTHLRPSSVQTPFAKRRSASRFKGERSPDRKKENKNFLFLRFLETLFKLNKWKIIKNYAALFVKKKKSVHFRKYFV